MDKTLILTTVETHFLRAHIQKVPLRAYPYVDCYDMTYTEEETRVIVTVNYTLVNTCNIIEEKVVHYVFAK